MKPPYWKITKTWTFALLLAPAFAFAFDSGSTGADGAFNPTVNTRLQLPPSGIFNFTSVNIPAGVTVTFGKNVTNTPVVILSRTDITVAGTINLNGGNSPATGAAGNGNQGDDRLPGLGAVGGFDGGLGGQVGQLPGGPGLGPGGGASARGMSLDRTVGGGGAGYGSAGTTAYCNFYVCDSGSGGPAYGSPLLVPLIGGSGGGGGVGGNTYGGSGGGGGGGGILLAASGTFTVSGFILANGGWSGGTRSGGPAIGGGAGGGGSGGAIRIVASTIAGNGTISAVGGESGPTDGFGGGVGGGGRIRLEADTITRAATTSPPHTVGLPGPLFVASMPTLTIDSVAGVAAPATPTGNADIMLPADTPNPVTVVFKTTNVPLGSTVKLTLVPAYGVTVTLASSALTGTIAAATASLSVTLPAGPSALQAQTTYTIVASLGDAMRSFAGNERVERVELVASLNGKSSTNLITVSGKRHEATPEALAMLARMAALSPQGS